MPGILERALMILLTIAVILCVVTLVGANATHTFTPDDLEWVEGTLPDGRTVTWYQLKKHPDQAFGMVIWCEKHEGFHAVILRHGQLVAAPFIFSNIDNAKAFVEGLAEYQFKQHIEKYHPELKKHPA
jgi:hypothetical protein